jgi:hypothetical protein
LILILAFTVVLAACSSGGTGGAATTPPSPSEVQARLVAASDLGSDWKLGEDINATDLSSVRHSIPCPDVQVDPAIAKRLTAVTGIQFDPAKHAYKHLIELAITGDPEQLHSDVQSLVAAMDSCATTAAATPAMRLTVKRLAIPQLGDQRAAYVMIARESAHSTTAWYIRNAMVRVGPVAIAFGLMEIVGTPKDKPTISDETFVHLLQTAVAKLSA